MLTRQCLIVISSTKERVPIERMKPSGVLEIFALHLRERQFREFLHEESQPIRGYELPNPNMEILAQIYS